MAHTDFGTDLIYSTLIPIYFREVSASFKQPLSTECKFINLKKKVTTKMKS